MANDNLKGMAEAHNPEDMAKEYYRRARQKHKTAKQNYWIVFILFLCMIAAVVSAEKVAELTIGVAETSALGIVKKQWVEVQLSRQDDFNGIAIIRDGETAAIAGDRGLVMISDGDRRSWIKAPSNTERSVYGVALSDNGETAVAVGRRGLVRSSADGGETWANPGDLAGEGKDSSGVALSGDGMIAVAVGDDGLVRISRDGGKTWGNPVDSTAEDIHGVALSQNGKVAIFVGDDGLIRVSSDGGAEWNIRDDTREERGDFEAVAVSAGGETAIAVGWRGLVYRSANSGKNWTHAPSGVSLSLNAVALSSDGTVAIAVGDDGTVLVSTDRGGNWNARDSGTSNDLNAVALEKGDTAALIVGDNRTILRLTLPEQEDLSEITSVGKLQIRRSLSEEEEKEIEKEIERKTIEKRIQESQAEYDATKDKVLIYSTGLRIGSILVFLLWVRQMANLMHYNLRLAAYYKARGDAILLLGALKQPDEKEELSRSKKIHLLKRLMREVSPDDIDIGRSPRSVVEHATRLARAMLRREAKD